MCGRFTLHTTVTRLRERFDFDGPAELPPRFNIAPMQRVSAVRPSDAGRELVQLRWGLLPSWAKDPGMAARMINARSETAHEKPAFRTALRQRRCLVLADGFYEWKLVQGRKQPVHFRLADGGPFALAG